MRQWPTGGIAFGGDYNPEQWPRDTWDEDMDLMRRAGVTFVSLGIFSWSWLEPSKGEYTYDWLDEIMDLLHANGIAVDLATANATPPPWFSAAHPDILPVDRDGHRLWPGSRQAWCPSSPTYRDAAHALTQRLADRYHDHPALALWHVSNEFACHNLPCYCDTCAGHFRRWLERRYGSLERLNEAWATAFWSQRYGDWEEVLPPRRSTTFNNPTHELDFRRFGSDTLLDFFLDEKRILNDASPGVPVTTNFMTLSGFRHLDYHDWAPHQDIVSTDHYIVATLPDPHAELAFHGDLTRGLAGGAPWLLMEHSTSAVQWQAVNPAKAPDQTLRDSLAHVARGADTVGYFQWRQSRGGSEKFHSAMVPHAGPDSDRFREVCDLGSVLGRMGEVLGSRIEADVAILFDYENGWALERDCLPSTDVDHPEMAHAIHRHLRRRGVQADVVHPDTDLSHYSVIVAPTLYLTSEGMAERLTAATESGSHVLVTWFSGIADRDDHVILGGYPGAYRDLLGIRVEEFFPLLRTDTVALSTGGIGRRWSEDARLTGADALWTYAGGPLSGRPAATRHALGEGVAWYLGTLPEDDDLGQFLDRILDEAGVEPVLDPPSGVEVTRRSSTSGSWLFLLNHGDTDHDVRVPPGHDLVSDSQVGSTLHLAAGAVAVVRED